MMPKNTEKNALDSNIKARKEYRKKTKSVTISFNIEKENVLYDFLSKQANKADYIKKLIAADMENDLVDKIIVQDDKVSGTENGIVGISCRCKYEDRRYWKIIGESGTRKIVKCLRCNAIWNTNAKYLDELEEI